jgi:hypothetical protein
MKEKILSRFKVDESMLLSFKLKDDIHYDTYHFAYKNDFDIITISDGIPLFVYNDKAYHLLSNRFNMVIEYYLDIHREFIYKPKQSEWKSLCDLL